MRRHAYLTGLLTLALALTLAVCAFAQDKSPDELAKEFEDMTASTATEKPTVTKIVAKVEEGCKLLQAEGLKAVSKFKSKDSVFIFSGTYIWIHDMDGKMVMHPIKYKMDGNDLIGLKDAGGKLFFAEMNSLVKQKGAGWVDYMWPKPGEKAPSKKISYVKLCPVEGKELVLGCGVYDLPDEEIAKMKQ